MLDNICNYIFSVLLLIKDFPFSMHILFIHQLYLWVPTGGAVLNTYTCLQVHYYVL